MPFSPGQIEWMQTITKGTMALDDANRAMAARTGLITGVMDEIELFRDDMRLANERLKIRQVGYDPASGQNVGRVMDWKSGDRDAEVDTVHDLKPRYISESDIMLRFQVSAQQAAELVMYHEKLVALSQKMHDTLARSRTAGKRPLTPDEEDEIAHDIEREIWSPLVQAGIIPSNSVPDKFSQEARVFEGACKIYTGKLEEFTKTSSKHQTIKTALRIGTAATAMVGTLATQAVSAGMFNGISLSNEDWTQNAKDKAHLKSLKDAKIPKGDPRMIDAQKAVDDFDKRFERQKEARLIQTGIALGIGLVEGGMGFIDAAIDETAKKDKANSFKLAEVGYGVLEKVLNTACSTAIKGAALSDGDRALTQDFKSLTGVISASISGGLKGGRAVFRLKEAVDAAAADDPAGCVKALRGILACVADAIYAGFDAVETPRGPVEARDKNGNVILDENSKPKMVEDPGTAGLYTRIGAGISAAIKSGDKLGAAAAELIADVRKAGGNPASLPWGKIILNVVPATFEVAGGGAAVGASFIPRTTPEDAERAKGQDKSAPSTSAADYEKDRTGLFDETDTQKNKRLYAMGAQAKSAADAAGGLGADVSKLQTLMTGHLAKVDLSALEARIAAAASAQEAEARKQELDDFHKKLESDPAYRQSIIDEVNANSEAQVAAISRLVEEALPSATDLTDKKKADAAMKAVEALIKEAEACNQRWAVMTTICAGGASVLAAALPVAGIAGSITKLATDTAVLVRRSHHCNRWRKNMMLTWGNSSVYGPAIRGRLDSAAVQVSQQAIRVVQDVTAVVADALKLADASGMGGAVGAVGHGIEIGNNMARALTEFGFKMYREAEIANGWRLYKKALANSGDRKVARTAMRWNSTLSKCVIAYGIVIDKDPIAKEVARSCGLTPEIVADQANVCPKVVKYFETLYSDDPVVMHRIPIRKNWHPGQPTPTLTSWSRFKAAATSQATPPLARTSAATAALDRAFGEWETLLDGAADYGKAAERYVLMVADGEEGKSTVYEDFLVKALDIVTRARAALDGFAPRTGPCPDGIEPSKAWTEGMLHADMDEIKASLIAQLAMAKAEIAFDLADHRAAIKAARDSRDALAQQIADDIALAATGKKGGA